MSSGRGVVLKVGVVVGLSGMLAVGCGGDNPYEAARNTATTVAVQEDSATSGYAENPYIPENQNLSDCIGAVERPGCGSSAKGGWRQYLVLAVLAGGIAFIGWRIARGVKARDSVANSGVNAPE